MSIRSLYPDIRPSLLLDFANAKQLDPRITFTRTSTATYVGADGLIKTADIGLPRFDHDPETLESLGLLIEESRTNIVNNNSNVGSWNNASASQETANPIKGLYTHRVMDIGTDGDSPWLPGSNYTTGTVTMSMYIDAVNSTSNTVTMYLFGGGYISTTWTLTTGVPIHNGAFSINNVNHSNGRVQTIDCGGGIYRLVLTADYSGGTTASRFYVTPSNADTDYVIVAGMQMEQGSFPTSYIPTAGSSVTRSTDVAGISGTNFSSWYNQTKGTIYVESNGYGRGAYSRIISLSNLDNYDNRIIVFKISPTPTSTSDYRYEIRTGATNQSSLLFSPGGESTKIAFTYQNNDTAIAVNSNFIGSDNSLTVPVVQYLGIGNEEGASRFHGTYKKISYYPKRLTNDQLQTLTK